jgi:hypothetical protein
MVEGCKFEKKEISCLLTVKLNSRMRTFYALSFSILLSAVAHAQSKTTSSMQPASRIVRFYPNPATSIINFDFVPGTEKNYNFQVFSFLGKKVYERNNISLKTSINLSDFYRGVYIFQLRDKNGKVVDTGKFQVSK